VVLEFLLDLSVQAAAPAPLDKFHPQMHHKLPLLCWGQMPKTKSVFPIFKVINTTSTFKQWCLSVPQHCQLKVQMVTSILMNSVMINLNGKWNSKVANILMKGLAIVLSASDVPP
jgi:hypothetical protein